MSHHPKSKSYKPFVRESITRLNVLENPSRRRARSSTLKRYRTTASPRPSKPSHVSPSFGVSRADNDRQTPSTGAKANKIPNTLTSKTRTVNLRKQCNGEQTNFQNGLICKKRQERKEADKLAGKGGAGKRQPEKTVKVQTSSKAPSFMPETTRVDGGVSFPDSVNRVLNNLTKNERPSTKRIHPMVYTDYKHCSTGKEEPAVLRLLDPECSSLDCGNPRYNTPEKYCTICKSERSQPDDHTTATAFSSLSQVPSKRRQSENRNILLEHNIPYQENTQLPVNDLHDPISDNALDRRIPDRLEKYLGGFRCPGLERVACCKKQPDSRDYQPKRQLFTPTSDDTDVHSYPSLSHGLRSEETGCWKSLKPQSPSRLCSPRKRAFQQSSEPANGMTTPKFAEFPKLWPFNRNRLGHPNYVEERERTGDDKIAENADQKGKGGPPFLQRYLPKGAIFSKKPRLDMEKVTSAGRYRPPVKQNLFVQPITITNEQKGLPVQMVNLVDANNPHLVQNGSLAKPATNTGSSPLLSVTPTNKPASPSDLDVTGSANKYSKAESPTVSTINSVLEGTMTLAKQPVSQPVVEDKTASPFENEQIIFQPSVRGPEYAELLSVSKKSSVEVELSTEKWKDQIKAAILGRDLRYSEKSKEKSRTQNRRTSHHLTPSNSSELFNQLGVDEADEKSLSKNFDHMIEKLRRDTLKLLELEEAYRNSKTHSRHGSIKMSRRRKSIDAQRSDRQPAGLEVGKSDEIGATESKAEPKLSAEHILLGPQSASFQRVPISLSQTASDALLKVSDTVRGAKAQTVQRVTGVKSGPTRNMDSATKAETEMAALPVQLTSSMVGVSTSVPEKRDGEEGTSTGDQAAPLAYIKLGNDKVLMHPDSFAKGKSVSIRQENQLHNLTMRKIEVEHAPDMEVKTAGFMEKGIFVEAKVEPRPEVESPRAVNVTVSENDLPSPTVLEKTDSKESVRTALSPERPQLQNFVDRPEIAVSLSPHSANEQLVGQSGEKEGKQEIKGPSDVLSKHEVAGTIFESKRSSLLEVVESRPTYTMSERVSDQNMTESSDSAEKEIVSERLPLVTETFVTVHQKDMVDEKMGPDMKAESHSSVEKIINALPKTLESTNSLGEPIKPDLRETVSSGEHEADRSPNIPEIKRESVQSVGQGAASVSPDEQQPLSSVDAKEAVISSPLENFIPPEAVRGSCSWMKESYFVRKAPAQVKRRHRRYRSTAQKTTLLATMASERVNSELSVTSTPENLNPRSFTPIVNVQRSVAQLTPQEHSCDSRTDGEMQSSTQICDLRLKLLTEPLLQPAKPVKRISSSPEAKRKKPKLDQLAGRPDKFNDRKDKPAGDLIEIPNAEKDLLTSRKPSRLLRISQLSLRRQKSEYTLELGPQRPDGTPNESTDQDEISLTPNPLIVINQGPQNAKNESKRSKTPAAHGKKVRVGRSPKAERKKEEPRRQKSSKSTKRAHFSKRTKKGDSETLEQCCQRVAAFLSNVEGKSARRSHRKTNSDQKSGRTDSATHKKIFSVTWSPSGEVGTISTSRSLEHTDNTVPLSSLDISLKSRSSSFSSEVSNAKSSSVSSRRSVSTSSRTDDVSLSVSLSSQSQSSISFSSSSSLSSNRSITPSLEKVIMKMIRCRTSHGCGNRSTGHRIRTSESPAGIYGDGTDVSTDSNYSPLRRTHRVSVERRCRSHCTTDPILSKFSPLALSVLRLFRLSNTLKDLSVHLIYRELKGLLLRRLAERRALSRGLLNQPHGH
ncbi:unnamed protein product [Calicophoron daubneyi]|uniref:Uncharacterized protein n=1 Tax=Calicophoron daubneyi TaxID=300641 RepID=A0AAV2T7F6_CALDB